MRWLQAAVFSFVVGVSCAMTQEPTGEANTALIAENPPPKAKSDTMKASPGNGYFWVKGHWSWKQEQWKWVSGYWEKARAGYTWVEPRYEVQDGQHVYILGGWIVPNTAPYGNTGSGKDTKTP